MSRKQFLWLMLAVVVMCGAGFALFWQDLTAYRDSGAKIGAQLLPQMKISDVAKMRLQDATGEVTLAVKDKVWRVEQRGGYPADFAEISGLILKLLDVKVVQSEVVGASLHGRLNLLAPDKGARQKDAKDRDAKEGTGTLVELSDAAGKVLASMVLGKVSLKLDPMNPLPNAKNGVPAGRHILVAGKGDNVFVVSDPLEKAVARPGAWLAKDFFKIDRIKTLQLVGDNSASSWKITRDEEWGQWKFATGGGQLHPSAAVTVNNAWSGLAFTDVVLDDKTGTDKAVTFTAQTFDDLTYTVKLAPYTDGDFVLRFSVTGTPPKTRKPEPNEKAEDVAKRDKEFADNRQRIEARVMLEQARSQWAYVVPGKQVEPLLLKREQMVAAPRPPEKKSK
jgi:hypothetical protein